MTGALDQTSEAFRQRFSPRDYQNVSILAFGDHFGPDDLQLLTTGVAAMVRAGTRGFVFELSQCHRDGDLEEQLGDVGRCIVVVYRLGGILNWLHGARFVQEWKRLKLLGVPPENFETEREAIEGLRISLKAARIRIDLAQRLSNSGVSAKEIANVAGLFESDVRRIAAASAISHRRQTRPGGAGAR